MKAKTVKRYHCNMSFAETFGKWLFRRIAYKKNLRRNGFGETVSAKVFPKVRILSILSNCADWGNILPLSLIYLICSYTYFKTLVS